LLLNYLQNKCEKGERDLEGLEASAASGNQEDAILAERKRNELAGLFSLRKGIAEKTMGENLTAQGEEFAQDTVGGQEAWVADKLGVRKGEIRDQENEKLVREQWREFLSMSPEEKKKYQKLMGGRLEALRVSGQSEEDYQRENFKIFSASADQSFGFLVTGKLFPVDESIQSLYLDSLEIFTKKLLETKSEDNSFHAATKLPLVKQPPRKLSRPSLRPSLGQLEEVWTRDNYSCVYCAKALIHPNVVKQALLKAKSESISWLNSRNEKISEHLIEAHKASFDHHLPAAKFAVLNLDSRNLFASCRECNQKKSASLASKTWTPRQVNSWANFSINNPLELAGVKFISALEAIYDN
jgi:5-methylcytosine-specific restriction endonuclease McrA